MTILHQIAIWRRENHRISLLALFLLLAAQGAWAQTTTQTIALNKGYNWVSFNVKAPLNSLKTALVEALPGTIITIESKTQKTTYNPQNSRWTGSLILDLTQMYQIQVPSDCEMTLENSAIDPAEHPITINTGDNWIGFPLSKAMTVAEALAGFEVTGCDFISSQTAFAFYTGDTWRGTLTTLEPGKGYIYHSVSSNSRTFTFPTPEAKSSVSGTRSAQYESHWPDFDYHAYQFFNPVVATIQIDGTTIGTNDKWEDIEVAAFVGDECRGRAFMADYSEVYGDPYPVVELTVFYNETNEPVTFLLYNHDTEIEYDICTTNIGIVTGDDHVEFYTNSDESVMLNFTDYITLTGPYDGLYWATFYCGNVRYTLPEGAQAYTMDADYNLYRLGTDGRTIRENTAVVIIADTARITLTKTDGTSSITDNAPDPKHNSLTDGNILQGGDSPVDLSDIVSDPQKVYVLGMVNNQLGFYEYSLPTIPAHKAYYVH